MTEQQLFGVSGSDYDWDARNPAAAHAELTAAEEAQASLAKRINKKVIAMFDKAEVRSYATRERETLPRV